LIVGSNEDKLSNHTMTASQRGNSIENTSTVPPEIRNTINSRMVENG